jgi:alcohol dehydrogenase
MSEIRSLFYVEPGQVRWRSVSAPVLAADTDALVRPIASSTCDLDRRIVAGRTPMPGPFALGHEAVGEVVAVGDAAGAAGLRPGDRVVIPWHLSCGSCAHCLAGRPANCSATPPLAAYGVPLGGPHGGLFDDLVRVPYAATSLVPLPDGLDPAAAVSCSDNLTDAYQGVRDAMAEHPGARVLIVGGTASLGLFAVMFAAALGAGEVTYIDKDPEAVALATRLGAAHVICARHPERVDGVFEATLDASGSAAGLACALRSTAPGGTCSIRSVYFTDMPFPYFDMYAAGITVRTGLAQITPNVPAVLDLLRTGAVQPGPVYSAPLRFDDAPAVLLDPPRKPVFVR